MTSAPKMMASTSRGLLRCAGADRILSTTTTRRLLQSTRATPLLTTPLPTTPLPVGVAAIRQFSASARNAGFLRGKAGGFNRDPFHKTWLTQHQQAGVLIAIIFTVLFFNDYFIPEKPEPGTFQWWLNQKPSRTTVWYPKKEVVEEEMD